MPEKWAAGAGGSYDARRRRWRPKERGTLPDGKDYQAACNELNGHKKTVSKSETVVGQHAEKITELPTAKSGKPMEVKTFRPTRGSQLSGVPRFINRFFG